MRAVPRLRLGQFGPRSYFVGTNKGGYQPSPTLPRQLSGRRIIVAYKICGPMTELREVWVHGRPEKRIRAGGKPPSRN